jgi:formylglycine-generating enzyme required for sulfatase activity
MNPKRFATLTFIGAVVASTACHDVDSLKPCAVGTTRIAGRCTPTPTCDDLAETCGPTKDDSCCAGSPVAGGDYQPYVDAAGDNQEGTSIATSINPVPFHSVIGDFYLDRYELTVGRFKRFLRAYDSWILNNVREGGARNPNLPRRASVTCGEKEVPTTGAWQAEWNEYLAPDATEFVRRLTEECGKPNDPENKRASPGTFRADPDTSEDTRPMTCLNWFEAFAVCMFDGARLPTEAEWNYAAAGGAQERPFPWASGPDYPDTRSFRPGYAAVRTNAELAEPVGSFPLGVSVFGQHDMAGNAWEWVLDAPATAVDYPSQPSNPVNLCGYHPGLGHTERVLRGGSYEFGASYARTSARMAVLDSFRYRDIGVRCARPAVD